MGEREGGDRTDRLRLVVKEMVREGTEMAGEKRGKWRKMGEGRRRRTKPLSPHPTVLHPHPTIPHYPLPLYKNHPSRALNSST